MAHTHHCSNANGRSMTLLPLKSPQVGVTMNEAHHSSPVTEHVALARLIRARATKNKHWTRSTRINQHIPA